MAVKILKAPWLDEKSSMLIRFGVGLLHAARCNPSIGQAVRDALEDRAESILSFAGKILCAARGLPRACALDVEKIMKDGRVDFSDLPFRR